MARLGDADTRGAVQCAQTEPRIVAIPSRSRLFDGPRHSRASSATSRIPWSIFLDAFGQLPLRFAIRKK
jgi:hypothetical protein